MPLVKCLDNVWMISRSEYETQRDFVILCFARLGDKCSPDIKFCPFNFEDEGNYTCRAYNTKGDALTRLATLQACKYSKQRKVLQTNRGKEKISLNNREFWILCKRYIADMNQLGIFVKTCFHKRRKHKNLYRVKTGPTQT